jgi:hypothetical protein
VVQEWDTGQGAPKMTAHIQSDMLYRVVVFSRVAEYSVVQNGNSETWEGEGKVHIHRGTQKDGYERW